MSKLNSKMYKNKMLEENKKSENSSAAYSDQIQVRLSYSLDSFPDCLFQDNPGGGSEDAGAEKMLPGTFWNIFNYLLSSLPFMFCLYHRILFPSIFNNLVKPFL